MTSAPPRQPEPPVRHASREAVEVRIAVLRAELEAALERGRQAVIQHEIAHIVEHDLGNEAQAVKEYLAAYNLDPTFRPPLLALIRIFERRRSFKNLARLYEAAVKSAGTAAAKASALVDRGALAEDRLDAAAEARRYFEQALAADPSSVGAALALERIASRQGDVEATHRAIEHRAGHVGDPALQAALAAEVALYREGQGDVDGAATLLREAAGLPLGRWRTFVHLERLARRHGRTEDLILAIEGRAVLASAAARGEDAGGGSGVVAIDRLGPPDRAAEHAAALWYEGARIRLVALGDAAGAAQALDQALALRPDDVLLRQTHMLSCELAGDAGRAAEDARALLEHGVSGRIAAALHFRVAELAQAEQDEEGARAALGRALDVDPGSAAALAMLDDLLLDAERHDERIARLEALGTAGSDATTRSRAFFRAAQIASEQIGDFGRAQGLYRRAIEVAEDELTIVRELYGAATRHRAWEAAADAARRIATTTADREERGALLHHLHELLRGPLHDADAADAVLRDVVEDETCVDWAPDAARLWAARGGDDALLARAHQVLAKRATDPETAAAHLCAEARARLRSGDQEGAAKVLRAAIERSPGHRYAVAMLEEILRSRGEAEEVVALLREAAAAQMGARAAEMSLLLAGASAEAAGDVKVAAKTYREAADRDETAVAPLWALRRLAERTGDVAMEAAAIEGLSAREIAASEAGRATLDLGEHHDVVAGKPQLAETSLRAVLDNADIGSAAAAALLLSPHREMDVAIRVAAVERLLREAAREDQPGLFRELAGWALLSDGAPRAVAAADKIAELGVVDRWAAWLRIRVAARDQSKRDARGDAFLALGQGSADPDAAAELVLHGSRAKAVALGLDAYDDGVILAYELAESSAGSAAAAVALDESLGAGDDPEGRADALAARLEHAAESDTSLRAAAGRAMLAAGRGPDAVSVLKAVVERDPSDLASWDALRVAAREAESWDDVVLACDRLAEASGDEPRAWLLEEAASVLMDQIGRDDEAEKRLREALAYDVRRAIAYGRMHDLLAEREDTVGLRELVTMRIEKEEDASELEKLFYEQARLLRGEGDREGALDALESLLALDEKHAGGLALAVEISVSLERWRDAVDFLRRLAEGDVPAKQKRLAHLGAADFLDKRLNAASEAIAELRKIEALDLADAALYERIADIAERSGALEDATNALYKAAGLSSGVERARYYRTAAVIESERLDDALAAIGSFRRALEAVPTDLESAELLVQLVGDYDRRRAVSESFETAVREVLDADPADVDTLRKLRRAATWRSERDLERAALAAIAALGAATPEEQRELADMWRTTPALPNGALSTASIERLRADGDGGPPAELARLAFEGLAVVDQLEPDAFGVGRGDLVSPKDASAVRDAVLAIASAFGLPAGDFYHGGREASAVAVVPGKKERPTWIVGSAIAAPLDTATKFLVGQLSLAMREATVPIVQRKAETAAIALFAAAAGSESPLPAGGGRAGVDELARELARALPRKARKTIADVAPRVSDGGAQLEAYCRAAQMTAVRAGLLVSGDLRIALEVVLGQRPTPDVVRASPPARDLLRFWMSASTLALVRELGLTA